MSSFQNDNDLNECFDLIKQKCNDYNKFSKQKNFYKDDQNLKCDSFEIFKTLLQKKRTILDHEKNLFIVDSNEEYFDVGFKKMEETWQELKSNIDEDLQNNRSSFIQEYKQIIPDVRNAVVRSSAIRSQTSETYTKIKVNIIKTYQHVIKDINTYFLNLFYFLLNYTKESSDKRNVMIFFLGKFKENEYIKLLALLRDILNYFQDYYFKINLFKIKPNEHELYSYFIKAYFENIRIALSAKSKITFLNQNNMNDVKKLILELNALLLIKNNTNGGKSRTIRKRLNQKKKNTKTRMRKNK